MSLLDFEKFISQHGILILSTLVLGLVGFIVLKSVKSILTNRIKKQKNNITVKLFLLDVGYVTGLVVLLIMILSKLGVPTTSLIAVLGASSLAIGLALKNSLSNVAAGVIIILQRPYKLGDTVIISGNTGTVDEINLYYTRIKAADNNAVFIPNGKVMSDTVINTGFRDVKRFTLPIVLKNGVDPEEIIKTIQDLIQTNSLCLSDPAPMVLVTNLNDNYGIHLEARVWAKRTDVTNATAKLAGDVAKELAKKDIQP